MPNAEKMLSRVVNGVSHRLARRRFAPQISVNPMSGLVRLGSDYGGWTFLPSDDLAGSTIVSCGLGEDGTFDVEFAARFQARVIIVDPTPRAIAHFNEIRARAGRQAETPYIKGGRQPAEAYDLSHVKTGALILEPRALWVEETTLKFFAPRDSRHVSHSIVNLQNSYSDRGAYIEVRSITPEALLEKYRLVTIGLMKLDIEGAESRVIEHALAAGIRPRQILVEFDGMNFPSSRSRELVEHTDNVLRDAGYQCRYFDGQANFLYLLPCAVARAQNLHN